MSGDTEQNDVHDALVNAVRLAHLGMADVERDALCAGAERILGHIATMRSMDLEGVEPLVHPLDGVGVLREDEAGATLGTGDLMRIAPMVHEPYVKVPKVIDGGGSS